MFSKTLSCLEEVQICQEGKSSALSASHRVGQTPTSGFALDSKCRGCFNSYTYFPFLCKL